MTIELLTNIALEAEPSDPSHLVNAEWVTNYFIGKIKAPVRLVATANLAGTYAAPTLTLGAAGPLSVDGVQVAVGDRVLLVGQTTATQNGIYEVTDAGNGGPAELERADDFDTSDKVYSGVAITVREGAHANTTWRLVTEGTITLDATALEFVPTAPLAAASKYATTITGDGTLLQFPVDHDLGTTDVTVNIRNATTNGLVLADVTVNTANRVTIGFSAPAPTAAQSFRVVVLG